MKQINKQLIKVDFMRDFHRRRTFIASIFVTPSKPNLKMMDFEENLNRNTQRKLKTSHIGRKTGLQWCEASFLIFFLC